MPPPGLHPGKELLQTAEVVRTVAGAKEFGVEAGQPVLDLSVCSSASRQVIDRLDQGPGVGAQEPQGR